MKLYHAGSACLMADPATARLICSSAAISKLTNIALEPGIASAWADLEADASMAYVKRAVMGNDGQAACLTADGCIHILDRCITPCICSVLTASDCKLPL